MIFGAALAVGVTSAALGQSAEKFNLICSGTVVAEDIGAHEPGEVLLPFEAGPVPYSTHLRVNLSGKVFCQDDCPASEDIALVDPEFLLLRDDHEIFGRSRHFAVRRADGAFVFNWEEPGDRATHRAYLSKSAKGICTKAPFTTMPKNAF